MIRDIILAALKARVKILQSTTIRAKGQATDALASCVAGSCPAAGAN